jgi:hypothetical protein
MDWLHHLVNTILQAEPQSTKKFPLFSIEVARRFQLLGLGNNPI